MDFLYSVIGFLIAISVLVAVHEFGHYWVAKKLGVKVLRYSIGFGKPLLKMVRGEDKTEYVLAAIPLGGYVKMLGESDGAIDVSEQHRAFNHQPIWKRSLIVLAGPGINFLFAILAFFILGLMPAKELMPNLGDITAETLAGQAGLQAGDQLVSVDGKSYQFFRQHDLYIFNQVLKRQNLKLEVHRRGQGLMKLSVNTSEMPIYKISPAVLAQRIGLVPQQPRLTNVLEHVAAGSAAQRSGLKVGDQIIAIDGAPITQWQQLVERVSVSADTSLKITFQRAGMTQSVTVTPNKIERDGKSIGLLGVRSALDSDSLVLLNRSVGQSLMHGVEQTWLLSSLTVRMIGKMITGQVSHKNISGPITIAEVSGTALQISLKSYIFVLAIISISLGVMNLLPIPMLDGGHLLMYAVEAAAGRTSAEKVFAVGQRVGLFLLFCLMSLAFYNDIFRLLN